MLEPQEKIKIYKEVKEIRKKILREELEKLFNEINELELYDTEEREEAKDILKHGLNDEEINMQEQAYKGCKASVLDIIGRKIHEINKQ